MMDKLFIATVKENLFKCYPDKLLKNAVVLDWNEFKITSKKYHETKYIFSTWNMPVLSEKEIREYFPNLKAVFYAAGTVNYFAIPFLKCGVRVFSAWKMNAIPVAEFVTAQIVLANKGYFQLHTRYKNTYSEAQKYGDLFPGNYKTTVGVIGFGEISKKVIALLETYDLEIFVYSKHLTEEEALEMKVKKAQLNEIFQHCQTISNHMANKPDAVEILDKQYFKLMSPNATFINTGRGAQVNMEDLKEAMRNFPERTALLDVTDPEEPLEPDDDIWEIPNIFISPHRAGSYTKEIMRMGEYMIAEYERFVSHERCDGEICLEDIKSRA